MIPAGLALLQPRFMYMLQTYVSAKYMSQVLVANISTAYNNMSQLTIGERIKFLMDAQQFSIRKFSRMLDVSDTNIRNYIDKGTKPSSDVLEKILQTIPRINPAWLLTGEGEPFLPNPTHPSDSHNISTKNFQGNVTGTNHGSVSQTIGATGPATLTDCEKERDAFKAERDQARNEIDLLRQLLASKDETISALRLITHGRNTPD